MNDGLHEYKVVLDKVASILSCEDNGKIPSEDVDYHDMFQVRSFDMDSDAKEYICNVCCFEKNEAKRIARTFLLEYLEKSGVITRDTKSYVIITDADNMQLKILHKYPCVYDLRRKSKIIHQDKFTGYTILDVFANTEEEALEIANKLLDKSTKSVLDKFNFRFPPIIIGSERQIKGATWGRASYVSDHKERIEELTEKLEPCDKWNWGILYELKVTSQEYVVLFSSNAGDMYARGICDKYYHGSWREEEYGDSFD